MKPESTASCIAAQPLAIDDVDHPEIIALIDRNASPADGHRGVARGQSMFSAPAGAARAAGAEMYFYSRGMSWRLGHRIEVLEDSLSSGF
ncbi:hypothetical protein [Sorangium sp. So ce426]|uniref:hypothetical protein n=1 Tax=unclassified Sorangium TaxID=2621164 RepID=UPI003F5C1B81